MATCTYCGSDLAAYDPVVVTEGDGEDATTVGRFCNYACLSAHVEAAGLVEGACCHLETAHRPS